jgi:hypothetical protein
VLHPRRQQHRRSGALRTRARGPVGPGVSGMRAQLRAPLQLPSPLCRAPSQLKNQLEPVYARSTLKRHVVMEGEGAGWWGFSVQAPTPTD